MSNTGDAAQTRLIVEQVVEASFVTLADRMAERFQPAAKEPPIHPLVKWLVGAIAGLGAAAIIGIGFWLVSSVSGMQQTLARMDERMVSGAVKDGRVDELDRRVTKLEAYHQGGAKQ
ncbi:hypothetical protein [Novosphingobium sp. JCM 18896]|uniref:hypothetical protein n=1 Tax=Novosphingobium sp. JCM 18896 TaxID=2989731 RepID=UPI002221E4A0|nr:hypothetical protein [Novosphingobium sp. JCM 18896]MCW1431410.1 hypothetical protein [Novosphingobium sp. JCM 18896]